MLGAQPWHPHRRLPPPADGRYRSERGTSKHPQILLHWRNLQRTLQKTPWQDARRGYGPWERCGNEITPTSMKEFYGSKWKQIQASS